MNKALQTFDMHLPLGSLEAYIARVNQVPMLTAEEEFELARLFYEEQDLSSARRLVMAHLRFVVRVARGYSGYGLAQSDLIQEGNIGLMKAVKRFNPHVGVRLVSFAVHWIKAEMHEFILRNWRIVKIATTKAQRKLFFNLRSLKKRLGWFTEEEINDVAKELKVSASDVKEMEARLNAHDASLESHTDDDDEHHYAPIAFLESKNSDPADIISSENWTGRYSEKLYHALDGLDDRARDILEQRWFASEKATLHDLAAKYSVSAERIRQLEQQAIAKLKLSIVE